MARILQLSYQKKRAIGELYHLRVNSTSSLVEVIYDLDLPASFSFSTPR